MRLTSYRVGSIERYGAVVGEDGLVDLDTRLAKYPTLRALIAADALAEAKAAVVGAKPDRRIADVVLHAPVPEPQKIWCIGVNYKDRNEEYKDNSDLPKYPSLFCRAPTSMVGHMQPIERPKVSTQLDYEGEIVLVIGKGGRHIPRERALDHVFGLTLCNEGSVRDWLRHGKFNVTQGKNFEASGAIGPWIATADGFDGFGGLRVRTRVNGELRQDDTTGRLMFPFEVLIEYLSTFMRLEPGDLISTGTPTGAGARFDPPRWLVPGDVVEVEVPGVGTLRNVVEDERA